jgi:hypothetical protein
VFDWNLHQLVPNPDWKAKGLRVVRPAHPCTHLKGQIALAGEVRWVSLDHTTPGIWDDVIIVSADVYGFLSYFFPSFNLSDPDSLFDYRPQSGVGALENIDWQSLWTQYDDACKSIVPTSFLAGEDLFQREIFVSALKLILNPSRSVITLIDLAKRLFGRSLRHKTLGDVTKHIAHGASSGWLGFNFGVKPAVEDIRKTLDAHRKVSGRLAYLRAHPGEFIHVGSRFSSKAPITSSIPTTSGADLYSIVDHHTLEAYIGCQARVREDITIVDTWNAYLQYFGFQHIVGLAWELIPFSFVVDWFTDAQEWIRSHTSLRQQSPFTEFRNFCCSTKESTRDTLFCTGGNLPSMSANWQEPVSPVELGWRSKTDYRRFLRVPDAQGVLDFSHLGFFQLIASGALLVQRASKTR